MSQSKQLKIQPVDRDVDLEGRHISMPFDNNLTIGGLKAEITNRYALMEQTNIVIRGLKEDLPSDAVISKLISGTEVRFSASGNDQVNQDLVSKGLKVSPNHKLTIGDNVVTDDASQLSLIQNPEGCKANVDANIKGNQAQKKGIQQNGIVSGDTKVTWGKFDRS